MPVNAYRLGAQSQAFEDILSIPMDGLNEVAVAESKAVLDLLLPYCGQDKQPPFDLAHKLAWRLIKAFDKYESPTETQHSTGSGESLPSLWVKKAYRITGSWLVIARSATTEAPVDCARCRFGFSIAASGSSPSSARQSSFAPWLRLSRRSGGKTA